MPFHPKNASAMRKSGYGYAPNHFAYAGIAVSLLAVVGARSAIFAPVQDLRLVVVDEEHEPAYKQDETPRYHGRDTAVMRAKLAGARCVLGSATPSLESRYNAERGKYGHLLLPERIQQRPMPKVELIDMRQEFLAFNLSLVILHGIGQCRLLRGRIILEIFVC